MAFIEELVSGEMPSWSPFLELAEATAGDRAAFEAAEAACPQPDSW